MVVGIDASRAFLKRRTGIEEYSYQVIRHLRSVIPEGNRVILYVRKRLTTDNRPARNASRIDAGGQPTTNANVSKTCFPRFVMMKQEIDFDLPKNWEVRAIWAPRFWTQVGLSIEMLLRTPDVLFVPAHTVPIIHPKRSVVTVHGLEYEMFPGAYTLWERLYMRLSIRFSVRAASRVIAVSENTKRDLVRLYGVPPEKVSVIYEGASENNFQFPISNFQSNHKSQFPKTEKPYLIFVGRLEERKNVARIIEAFELLKQENHIPHELVLVGKPGYGYEKIWRKIQDTKYKIHELGYVSEEEKRRLLAGADIFLFPTLYEGFGLPVLEAQAAGIPVVTSDTSSLPEIAGSGAVFVDPLSSESIAAGIAGLLSDDGKRSAIIRKGLENAARFDWKKCAYSIAALFH